MPTQLPHRRRNGQKQGAGMRVVISLRKPTSPASTHTLTHQHTRLGWNVQMHRPNVNPGNHIQRKIPRSSAPRSSIDLQQKKTAFRSPEVKAGSPAAAHRSHPGSILVPVLMGIFELLGGRGQHVGQRSNLVLVVGAGNNQLQVNLSEYRGSFKVGEF